jgi:uncharacterized protein YbjT (DUF2867 family)
MSKILVTGASGTNGQALIKKLRECNADFVAGSRNPEKDTRKFDYADPFTYEGATEGVDRVFLLGPPMQADVDKLIIPFIDHLAKKGIKRVVYFSAMGAEKLGLAFHDRIEQKLKDEGFDYTILQPTFFAQNFKNYEAENILDRNIVFMPAGEGKVAFVDVDDIAEVAAAALTENHHSKKTYKLTGAELLSYQQVADILSDILGKKVSYANPSADTFREVVVGSGAPGFIADYLIGVYGAIAGNHSAVITTDFEEVTGKKPNTLRKVLARDFMA